MKPLLTLPGEEAVYVAPLSKYIPNSEAGGSVKFWSVLFARGSYSLYSPPIYNLI
jgi:hypothetical protein